ncbi:MAG: hypothetical protein MJ053_06860 [Elusimicrobiaceae bacterium]|nr:hypothetical protein [Elusimicrobiaceae bacterium]
MNRVFYLFLAVGLSALPLQAQNVPTDVSAQEVVAIQAPEQPAAQAATSSVATSQAVEAQPAVQAGTSAPEGSSNPQEQAAAAKTARVVFNPKNQRDPTLSPDDVLLMEHREKQRLAALAAERKRQEEEARRRALEEEKKRAWELYLLKHPEAEVKNKIRIGGIVGQEVFIGSKIYTVGNTVYGARIVAVSPDSVVFSYKGRKFVRKIQL